MNYDLGNYVPLAFSVTDTSGVPINATVVLTVTLPDGSTATPATVNGSTGSYTCNYVPTLAGRHQVRWVATGAATMASTDEFSVRNFTKMGIVSLSDVKNHLNYTSSETSDDVELRRIMDVAQDMAENFTGVVLGRETFTAELHDGGDSYIKLNNPFALSVASVLETGVTLDSSLYTLDSTGQRLLRISTPQGWTSTVYGFWAPGVKNISVTYTAGFVEPPYDAAQGVLEIIRHLWQTQRGAYFQSGGSLPEDINTSGMSYSMPLRAQMLLAPTALPGMA